MKPAEAGTLFGPLRLLFGKGVRYGTIIDVGCADGHFFLALDAMGIAPGAVPMNIDANDTFRDSLQAIKDVVGGDFYIGAVTDDEGEIELTTSVHPYWSSLRPAGDIYWKRVNDLSAARVVVPATTLDLLMEKVALKPPFLLKLDVQGAEASVLRGGARLLEETHAVICESDMDDFQVINAILVEHGFFLYDATHLERLADGTLGWFHPVYVNPKLAFVQPKAFWDAKQNEAIIRTQVERRRAIRESNAKLLAQMAAARGASRGRAPVGRNEQCPCGSGRKYKHCCGRQA